MIQISPMFKGKANPESARRFLTSHGLEYHQIRKFCGVPVSSLALGTYLGNLDELTDSKVTAACLQAIDLGCNFFDTAINYRAQRAERSVGEAIRRAVLAGKAKREDLFVSTKGGFVPCDRIYNSDIKGLFQSEYVAKGLATQDDLIAGCHCMEPKYLDDQIEKSRKNLGLETIDLYYLHNPETQLEELPERVFYVKLKEAFEVLERAVADGRIGAYGLATWSGFREEPASTQSMQLETCLEAAKFAAQAVGAKEHHFKAIQLPLNLAMPEAALVRTQKIGATTLPAIEAAKTFELDVAVSVPLFQARLCHGLPDFIVEKFPEEMSQAHCALAFTTAFASVDAAMVGMKDLEHVKHNLALLKKEPLSGDELRAVIEAMVS